MVRGVAELMLVSDHIVQDGSESSSNSSGSIHNADRQFAHAEDNKNIFSYVTLLIIS
ncbi:hypothetical protein ABEB36_002868 [Hypothenemus hampei]|uniref:Uncharacterized protein n=1 Tax=Hypothenemus hampei TaxID=57062 RepID=A0ABD1F7B4_HYPHA